MTLARVQGRDEGPANAMAEDAPRRRDWRPWAIVAAYAAAWWPMLLNGGRYWDDWCVYRLSPKGAALMADQLGQVWQRYYWLALGWWPGAEYLFHMATFALFGAVALLLYGLLRRLPGVSPSTAALVAAVSAVFPVNAARFVHVNMQYTLSLAVFCFAWYLLALDLDRPRLARRILAGALFAASMLTMNSLLMFFALVPAYLLWARSRELREPAVRRDLAARYGALLVLPVAVFAFRTLALHPWGVYRYYNTLTRASVLASPSLILPAVRESFVKPLLSAGWWFLLAVPLYLVFRSRADGDQPAPGRSLALLGAGVLAFFLGVFPYLAVGKLPRATGFGWDLWDSRHQVLVPLGAALVVCGALLLLARVARLKRALALALIAALVFGFVVADVKTSFSYQADWYKQVSLMRHMARSDEIRDGNYFIVRDDAVALNVVDRRYLPYELSGMLYAVFGDATRFAIDEALMGSYAGQLTAYQPYEQYHWRAYQPPARGYLIHITPGHDDIRQPLTLLGLMWQERFDRDAFEQQVYDVVGVDVTPAEIPGY